MEVNPIYEVTYYYNKKGQPDKIASFLNCFDAQFLFHSRRHGTESVFEPNIFLSDFTFSLVLSDDETPFYIGAKNSCGRVICGNAETFPYHELFEVCWWEAPSGSLAHAAKVAEELALLTNQGQPVSICTKDSEIPCLISSASNDNTAARNTKHYLLLLHIKGDEVLFVDHPSYINFERYIPDQYHRGIGVMRYDSLLNALRHGASCFYATPKTTGGTGSATNSMMTLMSRISLSYLSPEQRINGYRCIYGASAYSKAIELISEERMDLYKKISANYYGCETLCILLDWKFYEMLNMRKLFNLALQQSQNKLPLNKYQELLDISKSTMTCWSALSRMVCVDPSRPDNSLPENLSITLSQAASFDFLLNEIFSEISGYI